MHSRAPFASSPVLPVILLASPTLPFQHALPVVRMFSFHCLHRRAPYTTGLLQDSCQVASFAPCYCSAKTIPAALLTLPKIAVKSGPGAALSIKPSQLNSDGQGSERADQGLRTAITVRGAYINTLSPRRPLLHNMVYSLPWRSRLCRRSATSSQSQSIENRLVLAAVVERYVLQVVYSLMVD